MIEYCTASPMTKKYYIVGTVVIAAVGLLVALIFDPFLFWEKTELASITWEQPPNVILIPNGERESNGGILFIRLRDGKEQFIAGTWNVSFSDYGNVIVYGSSTNKDEQAPLQTIYYIQDGENIFPLSTKQLPKNITEIRENRRTTYLAIEALADQRDASRVCLLERLSERLERCFDDSRGVKARWNNTRDQELILKMGDDLYRYDPWERAQTKVLPEENRENYEALLALFDASKTNNAFPWFRQEAQRTTLSAPPLFLLFSGTKKTPLTKKIHLFYIPPLARLQWITDTNHLLIKHGGGLGVIELSTRRYAPILTGGGIKQNPVFFKNGTAMHTLF